jgi:hypothetical protein
MAEISEGGTLGGTLDQTPEGGPVAGISEGSTLDQTPEGGFVAEMSEGAPPAQISEGGPSATMSWGCSAERRRAAMPLARPLPVALAAALARLEASVDAPGACWCRWVRVMAALALWTLVKPPPLLV